MESVPRKNDIYQVSQIPGVFPNLCDFEKGLVVGIYAGGNCFGDEQLLAISAFATVRELQLDYPVITSSSLQYLKAFQTLRRLWLYHNTLTEECVVYISQLSQLRTLNLRLHTPVSVSTFTHLARLTDLQQLTLDIPALGDEARKEISQQLPNCEVISLNI